MELCIYKVWDLTPITLRMVSLSQLKEFRQAVEDRHTHLYQNPYYPPADPTPVQKAGTTGEEIGSEYEPYVILM